jgi:hypothetical protein
VSTSRLFLIISGILFVVAALIVGGLELAGIKVEVVALVAFAFWVWSGAV